MSDPAMVEITYKNGRITRIEEKSLAAYFGENIFAEVDLRFDNLEEGLVAEVRHHEPNRPSEDETDGQSDARGLSCSHLADTYATIIYPEKIKEIEKVKYDGRVVLFNFQGKIVNMSKLNVLNELYLCEDRDMGMLLNIAEIGAIMNRNMRLVENNEGQIRYETPEQVDEAVAVEIGVPLSLLRQAQAFQADFAATNEGYAKAHGFAYEDEEPDDDCDECEDAGQELWSQGGEEIDGSYDDLDCS
jgi:hypothetical protein